MTATTIVKHAPTGAFFRDHDCTFSIRLCWPQDDGRIAHGGRCPECGDVYVQNGVMQIFGGRIIPKAEYEAARETRSQV